MPALPPDIAFIVSLLVSALSNYLRSDKLPRWANALIAILSIVVIALAMVWLTTGFTANLRQDVLLIIGMIVALFSGLKEVSALLDILQAANSPLAPASSQPPTPIVPSKGGINGD